MFQKKTIIQNKLGFVPITCKKESRMFPPVLLYRLERDGRIWIEKCSLESKTLCVMIFQKKNDELKHSPSNCICENCVLIQNQHTQQPSWILIQITAPQQTWFWDPVFIHKTRVPSLHPLNSLRNGNRLLPLQSRKHTKTSCVLSFRWLDLQYQILEHDRALPENHQDPLLIFSPLNGITSTHEIAKQVGWMRNR